MAVDPNRLRAVFLEEFEEHRAALQAGLLELEQDPAAVPRLLPELFRAAHSLKGGAQAVRLPTVATVCHRLEERLSDLRAGAIALEPSLLDAMLQDLDELTALVGDAFGPESAAEPAAPDRPAPPPPPGTTPPPPPDTTPPPPAAATTPPAGGGRATGGGAAPTRPPLRVPAHRLDRVLDRAGDVLLARDRLTGLARAHQELTVARAAVDRRWEELRAEPDELPPRAAAAITAAERAWQQVGDQLEYMRTGTLAAARLLNESASGLEHSARTLRLQPFRQACEGFDRAVRDLTHGTSPETRRIDLVVDGGDVELDGEIVTALREPLLHLLRNAVAHGIEAPEARRRAGKSERGTVRISANALGDRVQVAVSDDGAGLDVAGLRAEAVARGIDMTDDDADWLPWLEGLSTAEATDEVAGRGVGLDAVRSRVEGLGGTADLDSQPGHGCTITLHVPVTLSTLHVLVVQVGEQTLALPSAAIQRIARIPATGLRMTGAGPHAQINDELVRLSSLRAFLDLPPEGRQEHQLAVLLHGPGGRAALLVDRVTDARRITRRAVHPRLAGAAGVVGTTVLPSGEAVLVLNPLACVRAPVAAAEVERSDETAAAARRILLAEDSATTRALEQDILEGAGYDVTVAVDGEEAWRLLREHGTDLVVTDVEMPGMDGFTLCRTLRDHPRLADVPVVLVTSRASDEDRHRGVEVGANAYLVKGAFDQAAFLTTIRRLL